MERGRESGVRQAKAHRAAIDQRGEHAAADAEGVANRRHAQDDVEVLAHELNKVRVDLIAPLALASLLGHRPDGGQDTLHVLDLH